LPGVVAAVTEDPEPPRNAGPLAPVIAGLMERDPAARLDVETALRMLTEVAGGARTASSRPAWQQPDVEHTASANAETPDRRSRTRRWASRRTPRLRVVVPLAMTVTLVGGYMAQAPHVPDDAGMRLTHLGLPVRDEQRSRLFYATYFGFDPASAQRYDDGTVIIRNRDGFDLALHPADNVGPLPPFLHFGFRLPGPDAVRTLLARLDGAGIEVIERHDEPTCVAFKCLDPDGHRVEGYWEPDLSV
jgi:catechol 2,3-dioxygenase-like lactoylglutathione lyase family enzyme